MSAAAFSLQGKAALVTGANTGLGQAIAIGLAAAGANIAAAGRSDPAETTAAVQATGQRCHWIRADLGTKGIVYRVRLPGFEDQNAAKKSCTKLKSSGVSCYVSKSNS